MMKATILACTLLIIVFAVPMVVNCQRGGLIGVEPVLVEGVVGTTVSSPVAGLTVGKTKMVFELKIEAVQKGIEEIGTIRVFVRYPLTEGQALIEEGNRLRFLLNRAVGPRFCKTDDTDANQMPCYFLESGNVTELKDRRLSEVAELMSFADKGDVMPKFVQLRNVWSSSFGTIRYSSNGGLLHRNMCGNGALESRIAPATTKSNPLSRFAGINKFAVSGSGEKILAIDSESRPVVIDPIKGTRRNVPNVFALPLSTIAFSETANRGAVSRGKQITVFDTRSGRTIFSVDSTDETVTAMVFTADGSAMFFATSEGSLEVADAAGKTRKIGSLMGPIYIVSLSLDQQHALAGLSQGVFALVDLASGRIKRIFQGHTGRLNSIAFSGDGSRIVSSGTDGSIRVWRVDGRPELVVNLATEPSSAAAIFGNGQGQQLHIGTCEAEWNIELPAGRD